MATQAQIKINGVAGSNDDLPLNNLVNLSNNGAGGETTWEWTLLSQPVGLQVNFVDSGSLVSTIAAPQINPIKEGSYLLRLVVNKGLPDEKSNQVIAAVRELQTGNRIPAALETIENNASTGWGYTAVGDILQRVTRQVDTGVFTCIADAALSPGDVVHMTSMEQIAAGLPGERYLSRVNKALASDIAKVDGPLGVMVGQRNGDFLGVSAGEYCRVMVLGALSRISLSGGTGVAGDIVYVDDLGALSLTPGTHIRQIGDVAAVYPGPVYDITVAAVSNSIPRGNAGGDLSGAYPDPSIALLAVSTGKLADEAVTDIKVAAANKDGLATTPSMRTLGTGAQQACAGDDSRLSDARSPTGAAGGDLLGSTYPNPVLKAGAVTADKVSSTYHVVGTQTAGTTTSVTYETALTLGPVSMPGALMHIGVQAFGSAPLLLKADNTSTSTFQTGYMMVSVSGPTSRNYEYSVDVPKNGVINFSPVHITDTFAPGTYTITLQFKTSTASNTITWDQVALVAYQP